MSKLRTPVLIFTSPSGRYRQWAEMVRYVQRHPGRWLPVLWNVPKSAMRSVVEKRHLDLQNIPGGDLAVEARNTYRNDDGRQMCDLWMRWNPRGES